MFETKKLWGKAMIKRLILIALAICLVAEYGKAADMTDYSILPPFISSVVPPNVMLMVDVSGSMTWVAYHYNNEAYDQTKLYEGYFDPTKDYTLNSVDGVYYESGSSTCQVICADVSCKSSNQGFGAKGTYGCPNNKWPKCESYSTASCGSSFGNGNYLNYLNMTRMDLLRWAMTGGKPAGCSNSIDSCDPEVYVSPGHPSQLTCDADGCILVSSDGFTKVKARWDRITGDNGGILFYLKKLSVQPRMGSMYFSDSGVRSDSTVLVGDFTGSASYDGVNPYKNTIVQLNSNAPSGTTPTGPALWAARAYFAQEPSVYGSPNPDTGSGTNGNPYKNPMYQCVDSNGDGNCQGNEFQLVSCARNYIILLSDGQWNTPSCSIGSNTTTVNDSSDPVVPAYWMHKAGYTNLPTNVTSNISGIYTLGLFLGGTGQKSLKNVSMYGSFNTQTNTWPDSLTGYPQGTCTMDDCGDGQGSGCTSLPPASSDWDKDGNGDPDTFFKASDALAMKAQLLKIFYELLQNVASGTAASVISGTQSGEGAVYQSVFYPVINDHSSTQHLVNWGGSVHGLFVDSLGQMREDTNQNGILDNNDLIVTFTLADDGITPVVNKTQANLGQRVTDGTSVPPLKASIDTVKYLWTSDTWLNSLTDATTQRSPYSDVPADPKNGKRYIFTFIDANQSMIPNAAAGGQVDFVAPDLATITANLANTNTLYPYIPVNAESTTLPSFVTAANRSEFLSNQTQRVINFIRGADQGALTITGGSLPAFRSRGLDLDHNGSLETTWRLGDIVNSSPTAIGKPAEALHLLYKDSTYAAFVGHYQQRRAVIYTGANDGMLHAFNGGFFEDRFDVYNPSPGPTGLVYTSTTPDADKDRIKDVQYLTQPKDLSGNTLTTYAAYPLGAELWAYIPYNLLPHLYWLTETDYDASNHVSYVDLKPRMFDARIFTEELACSTSRQDPGCIHPYGWGTVLVGGMRFGGGKIAVDMNRTDGVYSSADRTMSSAYFILDITNPEAPPEVLGEIKFPNLGYTTCYPTGLPMGTLGGSANINAQNDWYLVFGSGPAESDGSAGTVNLPDTSLFQAVSNQSAKLYVLDLKALVQNKVISTLDGTGTFRTAQSPYYYQSLDTNSFISDPIAVDYQLDYKADVVYFGTVTWANPADGWNNPNKPPHWGGKMRRIVIENNPVTTTWTGDSVLLDNEAGYYQPITGAATASTDPSTHTRRWVFFGTGRYFVENDKKNTDTQAYYGIKEPVDADFNLTWRTAAGTVPRTSLVDVSNAHVTTTKTVTGVSSVTDWAGLISLVGTSGGWKLTFPNTGERNLSQAALLGSTLTYSTYLPSSVVCQLGGTSNIYGLNYTTGTEYYKPILTFQGVGVRSISLGVGLATTPNIHVGGESGTTAFIQSSTGQIITVSETNVTPSKSGMRSWWSCEQ